jgi:tRNA threonylcarbamoyl adenosine modification protein YeaZ
MSDKVYSAALDFSGPEAAFAVANADGKVIVNAFNPMRGRDSSSLAPWLIQLLKEKNLEVVQITRWTVGSGPGSFTGLRLAAAFVSGLTFDRKNVVCRCVPTAQVMAEKATPAPNDKIAVLHDGRNQELLLFGAICGDDGRCEPSGDVEVLNQESVIPEGYSHFAAPERDIPAIEKCLGSEIISQITPIAHPPVDRLLSAPGAWDNDLTQLVYIRPAAFVKPKF